MASTDLVFANEAQAKAAFADVRSNDTPTNWLLFTYSDTAKNTLDLTGTGTGGVNELKGHLSDTKTSYGLVRVTDRIDNSVTIKFVMIIWVGDKVPFIKKAQVTTHSGSVATLIGQHHNEVHASSLDDLSDEIIMSKVSDASGTAHHVKDSSPASSQSSSQASSSASSPAQRSQAAAAPKITSTKQPGVPKASTTVVVFIDEDGLRAAIKAVRADNDETDWMLMGYEGNTNQLKLVAKGANGLDELISHLKNDQILYGLYRTTDTIDNTVAVKFVLIVWVGETVPIIRKARITTHKGDVTTFLGQYHVDVHCNNLNEINEDIVRDLVQRASGTHSGVK